MKCVKMRHLPSGQLSVAGQKRKVLWLCNKKVGRAPEIALNVLKNLLFFIAVERASRPALLSELSLGRRNGLVRPIGHIKTYRCVS